MKVVVYEGPRQVNVQDVFDARLERPTDVGRHPHGGRCGAVVVSVASGRSGRRSELATAWTRTRRRVRPGRVPAGRVTATDPETNWR